MKNETKWIVVCAVVFVMGGASGSIICNILRDKEVIVSNSASTKVERAGCEYKHDYSGLNYVECRGPFKVDLADVLLFKFCELVIDTEDGNTITWMKSISPSKITGYVLQDSRHEVLCFYEMAAH